MIGVALPSRFLTELVSRRPRLDYLEVPATSFLGLGELSELEEIAADYPLTLHAPGFSIGSADPLDLDHIGAVAELADRLDVRWVSDQLAWLGVDGQRGATLLPIPYNQSTLDHLVGRVDKLGERLGRRLLVENPSSYLELASSTISEPRFLGQLAEAADCGLRIDLAAVWVSSRNHGRDPIEYIDALPPSRVAEIHLAGHADLASYSVATRDRPIGEPVWRLYDRLRARVSCATVVSWDRGLPDLPRLEAEAAAVATREERS